MPWRGGCEKQTAFQQLKDLPCKITTLSHFNLALHVRSDIIDTADVGIGKVMCHRYWYTGISERSIANASKTLMETQHCYS